MPQQTLPSAPTKLNSLVLTNMPTLKKDYDPLNDEVPNPGNESYASYSGIQPSFSPLPDNTAKGGSGGTTPEEYNKAQPFKKTGLGY